MNNLKQRLYILLNKYLKKKKLAKEFRNINQKKVFVLGTPEHGNLGDQAIAYAQELFLKNNYKNYSYIEIPMNEVLNYIDDINKVLTQKDVVFIHGGGNMGSLYPIEEITRREVVKRINGKVISFPQSIFFENDDFGRTELRKSKKVYNQNKNFVMVSREQASNEIMKKEFDNTVLLTPDIVLSLNYDELSDKLKDLNRKGILVLFRNDKESNLKLPYKNKLIKSLKDNFDKVTISDTNIGGGNIIPINDRLKYLEPLLSQFSKSELVVTDRLHGMIFSYITKTPCIVYENNNPKILSTYETWLSDVDYIKLVDNHESLSEIIKTINFLKKSEIQQKDFNKEFDKLIIE